MTATYINSNKLKVPVNAQGYNTDHTNKDNLITYEEAQRNKLISGLNVSYVLSGGPVWCLDIDKCIDGGVLSALAQSLLTLSAQYSTYIEVSTSGNGLHVWGNYEGPIPQHACKNTALKIEIYTDERHIVLGTPIPHSPLSAITDVIIAPSSNGLFDALVAGYFSQSDTKAQLVSQDWRTGATKSGEEMLAEIVTRAPSKVASNPFGDGATSLVDMLKMPADEWWGQDKSSVDMSLLNNLAFHCDKHHEQMELAYRAANIGQYRAAEMPCKLDRSAGGGMTYLQRSILQAVADCQNTFTTKEQIIEQVREKIENPGDLPDSPCGYRLNDFYVLYNGDACKFVHLPTGNELGKGCFKDAFKIGPHEFENAGPDRILAGKVYSPGDDQVCKDGDIKRLNLWKCPPAPEAISPQDVAIIDDYFGAICPLKAERDHLKQWCAHLVQFPTIKILHAVVMYGHETGTGKSTLGAILSKTQGDNNTARVSNKTLGDQFNDWLCGATFGWSDELNTSLLSHHRRLMVLETIKEWITNRSMPIREMYQSTSNARNCINGFLFTSNDDEALPIDENDRRFFVLRVHMNMKIKEMIADGSFTRLNHEITGGQFITYFNSIDCSSFNPSTEAPKTSAKSAMIENARDSYELVIDEEIDCGGPLASNDYIFLGKLAEREGCAPKILAKIARRMGYVSISRGGVRYWVREGSTIDHNMVVEKYKLLR